MESQLGSVLLALLCQEKDLIVLARQPGMRDPIYWKLPGGRISTNETPHEAIIREVFEETGIDLSSQDLMLAREIPQVGPKGPYIQYLFIVSVPYALVRGHDNKMVTQVDTTGDKIESTCFQISKLDTIYDFMPKHKMILESLRQKA